MTTVSFSSKRLRASVRRRSRQTTMTASSTATLMVSNRPDLPHRPAATALGRQNATPGLSV